MARSPSRTASTSTMADVAREAGVSVSTVSHVLNGTRKVSPETVQAVEDAVARTAYIPNTLARSLAGATTESIGIALSAITNHYFSEVVGGIEVEAKRHGLMIFLSDTHDDPAQELQTVRALHQRRVDGIILAASADPDRAALHYLRTHAIPTVLIDRLVAPDFDQVGVENRRSTVELVTHLATHGHRRIALVSGQPGLSTTQERLAGYKAGLKQAGLGFDPALVVIGHSALEPARQAVRGLLAHDPRPDAIVTGNNLMTIGAMHALRDAGLRVPEDIGLAGFDDFDWATAFTPRLTVVAQPCAELGETAVRLLMRRLKDPAARPKTLRLTPTLRVRDSCGCALDGA
jgi:LacI family transcriptional regulator